MANLTKNRAKIPKTQNLKAMNLSVASLSRRIWLRVSKLDLSTENNGGCSRQTANCYNSTRIALWDQETRPTQQSVAVNLSSTDCMGPLANRTDQQRQIADSMGFDILKIEP